MEVEGRRVRAYDLGGGQRDIWPDYLVSAGCVVFVVDASDPDRFAESKAALDVRAPFFFFFTFSFFLFFFFSFFYFFLIFFYFFWSTTDFLKPGPTRDRGPMGCAVRRVR